ncbi:acetolactate synthase [Caballeronia grimmiae]|uniref:Acetolactate synthase n=1 Tax=Caballeronia grimmiae TaxID=1071679 RepID=A0ABQ1S506_9BURK|nr:acetolactate synthase [Caballeronia grimmiae]
MIHNTTNCELIDKGATVKASDLFVRALENEGVDRIFAVPGEENLDVVESLRNSSIELVITRHEQSAAFMAATHGRLTGRPGVCMATLGPGALNLVTGAAYAHLGAMPMVLITGQKAIMTARQARFQIVDIVATMKPLTKASRQIVSAGSIPTVVREAFRLAQEERPGPVHLELPEDVASEQVRDDLALVPLHNVELPAAQDAAIEGAAALLMEAERPLVMFGAASNRPRLAGLLTDFIRRTGIPFFNTQMGKGTVAGITTTEKGTELWMGTAALSERDYVHEAIDQADLILSIGHDTVEKPPFIMGPKGPKVIHVGYTPANVEQVFFPHAEVVGDVGSSLARLADLVHAKLPNAGALIPLREGILKRTLDRAEESRFPLTPQRIVHDVRTVMPADGIVALDNGMYKIWFARCYRTRTANALLLDNALATMGAGLPSAMMASLLYPERRVMAVCGDGGFMMNSQELETAVRLKLNLVVLIIQDDAYGMIRWKQAVDDFADWGLNFGNPDFVQYAQAYGAKGRRVESAEGLVPTLEAAFEEGGVQLVVVPVDYSENSRVLVDELRNRVKEVAQ